MLNAEKKSKFKETSEVSKIWFIVMRWCLKILFNADVWKLGVDLTIQGEFRINEFI